MFSLLYYLLLPCAQQFVLYTRLENQGTCENFIPLGGDRSAYKIIVGKPEGFRPLWKQRVDEWFKTDLQGIRYEDVGWIHFLRIQTISGLLLTRQWIFWFSKRRSIFFARWTTISLSRSTLLYGIRVTEHVYSCYVRLKTVLVHPWGASWRIAHYMSTFCQL